MAGLKLNHIYKVYPNGAKAVNDFCMEIEDKEFIVFVGPSGCGKSTTLRMIAGLEEITAGELYIGDELVNDVEPMNRDIAMVFQNYALYPHMTVYENMAFGLRLRKMPKDEIDRRVKDAAEILGITEYLQRKPAAMSGGQRQRVALGRALVREPKVFLLDEPLSNLDAKLRTQMRSEISKLHSKIQTTFVYVTHDQVEAMTMGTRIVVMKDGFVQQIDTPRNLYSYPVNRFVAGFIGTPQMNFYAGKLKLEKAAPAEEAFKAEGAKKPVKAKAAGDTVRVTFDNTAVDLLAPYEYFVKANPDYLDGEKPVILGIRLEHISTDPDKYPFKAKCRVSHVEDLGIDSQVYADFDIDSEDKITESATKVIIKAPENVYYRTGEIIDVSLDLSRLHIFDAETEKTVAPRIPLVSVLDVTVKGGVLSGLGVDIKLPPAMAAEDGEYRMRIPTGALSFGGRIKAKVIGEENVNGRRLVQTSVAGKAVFVLAGEGEDVSGGLAIDLKQCALTKGGEVIVAPLQLENGLEGKLIKSKASQTVEEDGKTKTVKKIVYTLQIAGKSFACPDDTAEKIVNGLGKKAFSCKLGIRFASCDAVKSEGGIEAAVTGIADYGEEKFAVCTVTVPAEGKPDKKTKEPPQPKVFTVCISAEGVEGAKVTFAPDVTKISVYDTEKDIRLV